MTNDLPNRAHALLNGDDGLYSEWATASAIAMYALNAGYTEDDFVQLVSASDFAHYFATEDDGRDRSDRLASRLSKVWARAEDGWEPPIRDRNDVRQQLESLSQRIAEHRWHGRTASKDRAVAVALVQWAHEIGVWTLDAGTRELGMRAGVVHGTAKRALERLAGLGLISRDQDTPRQDNHAQRWVLNLGWGIRDNFDPYEPLPPEKRSCGLNMFLNHPVFLGSALGQTAERVWLDLADNGESTAREIADRIGGDPKTIRRALDTKLVASGLVVSETRQGGRGRPAKLYQLDPSAGRERMDQIAESFGVLDWYDRTAERYERERSGYREAQRQRAERDAARFAATSRPAPDDWWFSDRVTRWRGEACGASPSPCVGSGAGYWG
ncbi:hypothetical protein MSIMFB_01084 [Mycobacterium simulans]|uniref:Uncharacterized protein n=1 Tax=Mycobacterium simulans TaxID=627089 RepID=A0A7Z7IK16_9MYCO|nr:hypothetical protein [Mycobacterium simulans]SOJ53584.1 hypothetical protein MSIMFB_01084 [Mycobacterium simulans]